MMQTCCYILTDPIVWSFLHPIQSVVLAPHLMFHPYAFHVFCGRACTQDFHQRKFEAGRLRDLIRRCYVCCGLSLAQTDNDAFIKWCSNQTKGIRSSRHLTGPTVYSGRHVNFFVCFSYTNPCTSYLISCVGDEVGCVRGHDVVLPGLPPRADLDDANLLLHLN